MFFAKTVWCLYWHRWFQGQFLNLALHVFLYFMYHIVVLYLFCTMFENFPFYLSFVKYSLFAYHRLIMYISLLSNWFFIYTCYWQTLFAMQDPEIPEFSHPLLWTEDQLENVSLDGARMLPPKLYLVVFFHQMSLVNRTRITCLDFRRPLEVLVVLYHMFIPHAGIVINVLAW